MSAARKIVFCHCAYAQVVPRAVKEQVLQELAASGVEFEAAADLCEMSARGDPWLRQLAEGEEIRVAACYPRAVRWLFSAAGAPLPAEGAQILNMRVERAEEVVRGLLEDPSTGESGASEEPARSESEEGAG